MSRTAWDISSYHHSGDSSVTHLIYERYVDKKFIIIVKYYRKIAENEIC